MADVIDRPAADRPSVARERLLRTAVEVFYTEGIHDVGVDRILDRAAVTRSTFYRHFPGKEDLVVAYVKAVDAAVRGALERALAGNDDPRRVLAAVAHGLEAELCRPGFRGCAFINAAAEYPDPATPVRRAVQAHRDWLRRTVTDALRRGGHPDPSRGALMFMMLRDGAMISGYLHDPEQARTVLLQGIADLLPA